MLPIIGNNVIGLPEKPLESTEQQEVSSLLGDTTLGVYHVHRISSVIHHGGMLLCYQYLYPN